MHMLRSPQDRARLCCEPEDQLVRCCERDVLLADVPDVFCVARVGGEASSVLYPTCWKGCLEVSGRRDSAYSTSAHSCQATECSLTSAARGGDGIEESDYQPYPHGTSR